MAGVADDQGFGWAISKCLAEAGCEVILGTWVPALNIFETSLRRGKFDESRKLSDGSLMEFAKVYPLDAVFDTYDDVPEDIRTNKRYAGNENWTVAECAKEVEKDFVNGDLHPGDVKPALARHINVILQPVRDHFVNDPDAKKLLDTIKKYKVTK